MMLVTMKMLPLLLITLHLSLTLSVLCEECKLPVGREVDVKKLFKTSWYSGLQTDDFTSSILTCVRFSNFTSTDSGFRVVSTEHGDRYVEFPIHFNIHKNGIYHQSKANDETTAHSEHTRETNGKHNAAISEMEKNFFTGNFVFLTDYKNYFAAFLCPTIIKSDEELRMIWGFFPSSNPTLKQIAAFSNTLYDQEISATFHPSTCSERDWNDLNKQK
ncbi:uncharacterized protein LOC120331299 [Styela clava]